MAELVLSDLRFRAFVAEGARCGITACPECGAAIFIDPAADVDAAKRHLTWHGLTAQEAT